MPDADPRFAARALVATADASRERAEFLASLELWLLDALKRDGVDGLRDAVTALGELGYAFASGDADDPPEWSSPLPGEGRRLVISGAATPAVEWISAVVEHTGEVESSPAPDPRHTAFYARWETLIGLDDDAVASLPVEDRMVHHIAILEGEVHNGGFTQYLENTEGRWIEETLDMLATLGAQTTHDLLREAQRQLDGARSDDATAWNTALERLDDTGVLEPLDDRFYELDDDLAALVAGHVQLG